MLNIKFGIIAWYFDYAAMTYAFKSFMFSLFYYNFVIDVSLEKP